MSDSGSAVTVIALVVGLSTIFFLLRRLATSKDPSVAVSSPAATITGQGWWFGNWWMFALSIGWCPLRLDLFDAGVRIGPSSSWYAPFYPTTDFRWSDIESVIKGDWSLWFVGRNRSTKGSVLFYAPWFSRSDVRFQLLGVLASTMTYHGVRVTGKER